MEPPVNLTNLRSMTEGDADLEKELFAEFFSSFDKGIDLLKNSCGPEGATAWRAEAHGLKGIALNLGAEKLGELCKKAQDESGADASAKQEMLKAVEAEYKQVKNYLEQGV